VDKLQWLKTGASSRATYIPSRDIATFKIAVVAIGSRNIREAGSVTKLT
jgi:hypothetical protein